MRCMERLGCVFGLALVVGLLLPGGLDKALAQEPNAGTPELAISTAANTSDSEAEASASEGTVQNEQEAEPTTVAENASADSRDQPASTVIANSSLQVEATRAGPTSSDVVGASVLRAAAATQRQVSASVSNLTIQNAAGQTQNTIYESTRFYLVMNWDASSSGANLHAGDYFDITLPNEMVFPSDSSAADFDLYGSDGTTVIARAHVSPGSAGGGVVRVTFTDWVEGRENVQGSISLSARFDTTKVTTDEPNTFEVTVDGKVVPVTVTVRRPRELTNEVLSKWSQTISGVSNRARWVARINHTKATLPAVVLTDQLSGGSGSERYIADSFHLYRAEYDAQGSYVRSLGEVDLADKLTIASDGRSFTLNLGDIGGDSYRLEYQTTYVTGTALSNSMRLTSTGSTPRTATDTYRSASSGGKGEGTLANRIRLTKVAADDTSLALAGATFVVTRPDGSTFDLTTGADGTVTSDALTSGTYTVREKTAPAGYRLNDDAYTLVVSSAGGALQTVTDEPETRSVSVTKRWVGPVGESVTVHLLADGEDTGRTLTLNTASGWSGTFEDLRTFDKTTGAEIVYTVREDDVAGYAGVISGNATDGFIITNTREDTPPQDPEKLSKKTPEAPKTQETPSAKSETTPTTPSSGAKATTKSQAKPVSSVSSGLPKTGDDASSAVPVALAAVGAVAIAAAVVLRRRARR